MPLPGPLHSKEKEAATSLSGTRAFCRARAACSAYLTSPLSPCLRSFNAYICRTRVRQGDATSGGVTTCVSARLHHRCASHTAPAFAALFPTPPLPHYISASAASYRLYAATALTPCAIRSTPLPLASTETLPACDGLARGARLRACVCTTQTDTGHAPRRYGPSYVTTVA